MILPEDGASIMPEMTDEQKKERIIFLRKERQTLDDLNKQLSDESSRLHKIRTDAIKSGKPISPGVTNDIETIAGKIKENIKKLEVDGAELNSLTQSGAYPFGPQSKVPPKKDGTIAQRVEYLQKEIQKLENDNDTLRTESAKLHDIRTGAMKQGKSIPPGVTNKIDNIAPQIDANNKKLGDYCTELLKYMGGGPKPRN